MNFATSKAPGKKLFDSSKTYAQHLMDFVAEATAVQTYSEDEVDQLASEIVKKVDHCQELTNLQLADLKIAVKKLFKKVRFPDYSTPETWPDKATFVEAEDCPPCSEEVRWQLVDKDGVVVATYDEDGHPIARIW